jgi:Conjugative transposon protein TcpC
MAAGERQRGGPALGRLRAEWSDLRAARLRAAVPRYLATAALLILVALGLRALLWPAQPSPPPRAPASADAPSEDFALQFARAYLTYDASRPAARARALAPFLPSSLDSGAGFFAASGAQRVRWAEVASDQPALAGGRTITVATGVSTQRLPVYLAVTVRHRLGEGLALLGYPCFVGAPLIGGDAAPASGPAVEEPAVAAVVDRVLRNYLARSAPNLKADLTPDAAVTLPTLALRVQRIERLAWIGAARSGAVLATLSAADARGATYTLAYELGIAYRERPYVDFIEVVPTDG